MKFFRRLLVMCVMSVMTPLCGDDATSSTPQSPAALDNLISLKGQKIADLNGKITEKQAALDKAQKELFAQGPTSDKSAGLQDVVNKLTADISELNKSLAEATAEQKAEVEVADSLKKMTAFITDAQSAEDDSIEIDALLGGEPKAGADAA